MFKFSISNKSHSLGVDFGTSSIKMVELEHKNGSNYLSNYGWVELSQKKNRGEIDIMAGVDEEKMIVDLIKKLYTQMDLKIKSASLSMGSYKGLSALLKMNNVDESDMGEIIKMEASKYIPIALDEVYLSSDVVSRNDTIIKEEDREKKVGFFNKKTEGSIEVLLVAAPKEDVHFYERMIETSGLKVASFELDIFSAVRSLVGDDLGTFLIVDIGARITNIIFVEKGIIRINRNINIGGDEVTKNIASSLNVSWDRADEFKKKNDYLKAEGKAIIMPIINIIAKESKRVVDLNLSSKEGSKLDRVVLTGGGSGISGIVEIFSEIFGSSVEMGNPWKNIIIENNNVKEISTEISPAYTVATGLALKGLQK